MSFYWYLHPLRTLKVWRMLRAYNKKYKARASLRGILRSVRKMGEGT